MAQGKGISAMMLLFCMLVLSSKMTQAKTYVVGDAAGWSANITNWPSGKSFNAGDILVFNYNSKAHNVVSVNKTGYETCTALRPRTYQTGHDHIPLARGWNYFISTYYSDCDNNMFMAVNAAGQKLR